MTAATTCATATETATHLADSWPGAVVLIALFALAGFVAWMFLR